MTRRITCDGNDWTVDLIWAGNQALSTRASDVPVEAEPPQVVKFVRGNTELWARASEYVTDLDFWSDEQLCEMLRTAQPPSA